MKKLEITNISATCQIFSGNNGGETVTITDTTYAVTPLSRGLYVEIELTAAKTPQSISFYGELLPQEGEMYIKYPIGRKYRLVERLLRDSHKLYRYLPGGEHFRRDEGENEIMDPIRKVGRDENFRLLPFGAREVSVPLRIGVKTVGGDTSIFSGGTPGRKEAVTAIFETTWPLTCEDLKKEVEKNVERWKQAGLGGYPGVNADVVMSALESNGWYTNSPFVWKKGDYISLGV